jgi:hypothetical protein
MEFDLGHHDGVGGVTVSSRGVAAEAARDAVAGDAAATGALTADTHHQHRPPLP